MNKLEVEITNIQISGGVILVDMTAYECKFSALLIDTNERPSWLKTGGKIFAVFKEAEVSLAKELSGFLSTRNRIPCQVLKIEQGELISLITMNFHGETIRSAITSRALEHLDLHVGDEVLALVKSNELTLMQKKS